MLHCSGNKSQRICSCLYQYKLKQKIQFKFDYRSKGVEAGFIYGTTLLLRLVALTASQSHAYLWALSIQEMFSEWWINKAWLHGLTNSTGQIMLLPQQNQICKIAHMETEQPVMKMLCPLTSEYGSDLTSEESLSPQSFKASIDTGTVSLSGRLMALSQ